MNKNKIIFLFLIFSNVFFSCDIFRTRDPEEPSQNRSNFLPPSSPDIVLSNFKSAITEENSLNYFQCLSNANNSGSFFAFIPAPDVQNQFRSLFLNWDINSEKSYFENLKSHTSNNVPTTITLDGTFILTETDSVVYNADYVITINLDISTIPQTIKGNLQFGISRDKNNNWSIAKWIDNKINNQFCWSELKARLSN